MKKILFILFALLVPLFSLNVTYAKTDVVNYEANMVLQKNVDTIAYKILNANKINHRMVFTYKEKADLIKIDPTLIKRNILLYDKNIQYIATDDEMAAYLSREIAKANESYGGWFKGYINAVQVKGAPKKYEYFFDKRGVDYMVKAGYNPLGMITYINKAFPQKRYDKISRHNLTSKRLANVYEYIYTKYPYYLKYNEYLENDVYQNFLLTSQENRKKLHEKIKTHSKKAVKYE